MKKSVKATVCAALCALLAAGSLLPALALTLGDMDSDNTVAAADARTILRAAVGLDTLTAEQAAKADMNTDGEINASDARLALRTAVGLELPVYEVYENQYDILRSGNYYMEMNLLDEGDAVMTIAVSGDKKYVSGNMEGVTFSFFTENGELWLLDNDYDVYSKLDADVLSFFGEDALFLDDFTAMSDMLGDFGDLKPLSEADYTRAEDYGGVPCTCYVFMDAEGAEKVYMDGIKLVGLVRVNSLGRVVSSTRVNSISSVIPAEFFNFRSTYTNIPDFLNFLIIAYGKAFPEFGATEDDIRALIEEAKQQAKEAAGA